MNYCDLPSDDKIRIIELLLNSFSYDLGYNQLLEMDEVLGTKDLLVEVIRVDNIIISVVLYTIDQIEKYNPNNWTYIEYICTDPCHSNRGYATVLLKKLPQPIYLHVVKSPYAHALLLWYMRNNFQLIRETPSHRSFLLSSLTIPFFNNTNEWDL
jgi:hypothetical protein